MNLEMEIKLKVNNSYGGSGGIYVSAIPTKESIDTIMGFLKSNGYPLSLDKFQEDAHMTIMYSKKASINTNEIIVPDSIIALSLELDIWDGHDHDGYLVLKVTSNPAKELHDHLDTLGGEHSFKTYEPHISINSKLYSESDPRTIKDWSMTVNGLLRNQPFLVRFDSLNIEDCKQF